MINNIWYNILDVLNYSAITRNFIDFRSPLTCTSQIESHTPHKPDTRKKMMPCSGVGFHLNMKKKRLKCKQKAKSITGFRPVNFTIAPVASAAIAFVTPKHIIT